MKFICTFVLWVVGIAYEKAKFTEASKATQTRLLNPLGILPSPLGVLPSPLGILPSPLGVFASHLKIDILIPGFLAQNVKRMQDEYDPDLVQQTMANYSEPASPNVHFLLYCNRNNTKEAHKLNIGDMEGLKNTCFRKDACVKFLVHGWSVKHNISCYFPMSTKDVYLELDVCPNIIVMDYSGTTMFQVYPVAVYTSVREGGHAGAAFLKALVASNYVAAKQIHLIGVSLGAHVAGYIASLFSTEKGQQLLRVTGLDPAGPLFDHNLCAHRLNPGDASFVDVYHTGRYGYGTIKNLGHVDFNINVDGKRQCYCVGKSCNHVVSAWDYEMTIRNGPEHAFINACNRSTETICLTPYCRDYDICFGEYIDYRTRGVHTIPIPLSKFIGPFFKAVVKCAPGIFKQYQIFKRYNIAKKPTSS